MKPTHKACGSSKVLTIKGKVYHVFHMCLHCAREIEPYEILNMDRRLSTVRFKGKAYHRGHEIT